MSKFIASEEAMPSELLLWSTRGTQTGIRNVKQIDYQPVNSLTNSDTINFEIPGQPNLLLKKVEIISKFKITKKDGEDLTDTDNVSPVSNFGHSLWKLVDVTLNSRVSIMSPMHNSYNMEAFFDTILNEDSDRESKLFRDQCFLLDSASNKSESENLVFSGKDVKNSNASKRAKRIAKSKSLTIINDLHCSLFKQSKALVPNLDISISLTKNSTKYFLLHDEDDEYLWDIEKVFLRVTYTEPQEFLLPLLQQRLLKSPASYECNKTEISTFAIPSGVTSYTFTNLFRGYLPHFVVFCVQDRDAISGNSEKNPFTFHPFKSIQIFINNSEYFSEPLQSDDENTLFFNQLYKACGYDTRGSCLITPENFKSHFMLAAALSRDRIVKFHHNLQEVVDFKSVITFEKETESNQVLLVYAVYDRIIKIGLDRSIEVINL